MSKKLQDMTLAELWALFPIVLSPPNPLWKQWAAEEMAFLGGMLTDFTPVISHVGSTAIPDIWAKPIIDLLVEVPEESDRNAIRQRLETSGYICMAVSDNRMSFNKGYTAEGFAEKVFHIHVHEAGDHDEIHFRDFLTAHPEMAKEYERLKLSLLPKYRNDRDGYTEAKSEFVKRIMNNQTN